MIGQRLFRNATAVVVMAVAHLSAAGPPMTVYKTRTCGCCAKWIEHVKANGFEVSVKEVSSTAEVRRQFGVPEQLASCHTATISGYVRIPKDVDRRSELMVITIPKLCR
jgi:hypothetical protein